MEQEGSARERIMAAFIAMLEKRYHLTDLSLRGQALLEAVCRGRGFLLRGGQADTDRACAVVLDEFRDGRLGRVSLETPREREIPEKEKEDAHAQ